MAFPFIPPAPVRVAASCTARPLVILFAIKANPLSLRAKVPVRCAELYVNPSMAQNDELRFTIVLDSSCNDL